MAKNNSEFKTVFSDGSWSDKVYRFLQVIFHLYPENKFHLLLVETTQQKENDEEIYKAVQKALPGIKPFLSELTLSLPALKKQKKEMASQMLQLLGNRKKINGYLEIGSTGRYISELRKHINLTGNIYLTNDIAPDNSLADIFERGQLNKFGTFFKLDYLPIIAEQIPDESLELITCNIGLHHCPHDLLPGFLRSINRVLRKGGLFIVREHNVPTPEMATFVSLVHTIFNLGVNVSWETNNKEFKSFRTIDEWSNMISSFGFVDSAQRILQDDDSSDNTLISFKKI